MKINKPFDELKQIFNDEHSREKLISKKYLIDFKRNKVSNIKRITVENFLPTGVMKEESIMCTYMPDSKYRYRLKFVKTNEGLIKFKVKIPSIIGIVFIGGILGLRFINEHGLKGIFLGIFLFYLISLISKSFIANGIKRRIINQWEEVIDKKIFSNTSKEITSDETFELNNSKEDNS